MIIIDNSRNMFTQPGFIIILVKATSLVEISPIKRRNIFQ
jgi:hypothetical protein